MSTPDRRLEVLKSTALLDSAAEVAFDRLTRLASSLLGAPVALVSLVDEKRQFFKSAHGLQEPWATRRQTPLTHSFCKHVTSDKDLLAVEDARIHPLVQNNLAIRDLDVVAYLGTPLLVGDEAIGSFCVIDDKPHAWREDQIQILRDLAESVVAEIELRLALRVAAEQRELRDALLDGLAEGVLATGPDRSFIVVNAAARQMMDDTIRVGNVATDDWAEKHRARRAEGTPLRPEDTPLARALRGDSTEGLEFSLQRAGAREGLWVEASGRPVRDADGQVIAAVSVFRDQTERKRNVDLYTSLARNIPRGIVFLLDGDLRCLAIDGELSRESAADFGSSSGSRTGGSNPLGRTMRDLAGYEEGDPRFDEVEAAYRRALAGEPSKVDFRDERWGRTLELHASPVRDASGQVTAAIVLGLDVTVERRLDAALRESEQVYRAMVQHLPNGAVLMVDRELRYTAAEGPIVQDMLANANLSEIIGKPVAEVSSEENREGLLAIYRSALAGKRHHFDVQRGARSYDLDVLPIFDGSMVSRVLVFLRDVTARRAELAELEASRAQLERQATELREAMVTDELTGLLNRRGFLLLAEQAVKVAMRNKQKMVLFFADLNGMKGINDTLGHKMGDEALRETAAILRRAFRASDVIARLGGDEFVVLATDAKEDCGPAFASRIRDEVAAHNGCGGPFELSVSVGTSIFDSAAPVTLEVLLAEADAGMYAAKQGQKAAVPPGETKHFQVV